MVCTDMSLQVTLAARAGPRQLVATSWIHTMPFAGHMDLLLVPLEVFLQSKGLGTAFRVASVDVAVVAT